MLVNMMKNHGLVRVRTDGFVRESQYHRFLAPQLPWLCVHASYVQLF